MGQTFFHVALRGVEAVERWFEIDAIPIQYKEDLYCDLFPIWMKYFSSNVIGEEGNSEANNSTYPN